MKPVSALFHTAARSCLHTRESWVVIDSRGENVPPTLRAWAALLFWLSVMNRCSIIRIHPRNNRANAVFLSEAGFFLV